MLLDKSIPYKEVWMKRQLTRPILAATLPKGFSFQFYQKGDEKSWSEIETSVLEFENKAEAMNYFKQTFAPYQEKLVKQMLFVKDADGKKVATCTAWQKEILGQRYPLFHWLAVAPDYQGLGLAKALVARTLQLFQNIMSEDAAIYLHTQTWSHTAIGLYEKFGFTLMPDNLDGTCNPDYPQVIALLEQLKK
ncbi:N-acetyltransferase [Enterococcus saigonensis]|uniref:N-acetyltransferase n=1 Tax=Enterococcus saigonensis TaxID=1805431 RepID=A0A679IEF9_9ENTE|nr:N-acetyltransferase [Enterococcus saigonensis]